MVDLRLQCLLRPTSRAYAENNVYFTDFRQGQIGRIDAKAGQVSLLVKEKAGIAPGLRCFCHAPLEAGHPVFQRRQRRIDKPRHTGSSGQAGR